MAKPTTKSDLIKTAETQFNQLMLLINTIPEKEQNATFLFEDRDKNLRDIFIHLYEWQQLLQNWIIANKNGQSKPFLPEPYNWKTSPQMNIAFWEKHQSTQLETSIEMFKMSHNKVISLIKQFSDEELFTKKYFSWTGTTSLGSYCISATSSHYDWAIKKIKKHIKAYKNK